MIGNILGRIISVCTFPGIIVHEAAHQLFCILTRTAVFEVCYLRAEEPMGYVRHEKPRSVNHTIIIAVGPFIVNSLIAAVIGASIMMTMNMNSEHGMLENLTFWLGLSIGAHAFPSRTDAQNIWRSVLKKETPIITKIIGIPITGLIYVFAIGSIIWLDFLWGALMMNAVPYLTRLIFRGM
jgi:hypothetical protein